MKRDNEDSEAWTEGYLRGREEAFYEVYMWLDSHSGGVTLARLLEDYRKEYGVK